MADPKYADLPGIATDQPDTYETNGEHGQDTDEESESETSETLHLSSLSWLGGELEIGRGDDGPDGAPGHETLTQKFCRLRCEVNELSDELDGMTESAREGSLGGLHKQVTLLKQQLEVSEANVDGVIEGLTSKNAVEELNKQLSELITGGEKSGTDAAASGGSYELYLPSAGIKSAPNLSDLDKRLAKMEESVGWRTMEQAKVLSAPTDSLCLTEAIKYLEEKKFTFNQQHLAHIEGRVGSLTNRLNALKEQKAVVEQAKQSSQVARLYDSLEKRAVVLSVLPDVVSRLTDLEQLHKGAEGWNSRISHTTSQQESTDKLLTENKAEIVATQKILADGLRDITDKMDLLQKNLSCLSV